MSHNASLIDSITHRIKILSIPYVLYASITGIFMSISLLSCIVISIIKDFDSTVTTHCGNTQFLPSFSSAVGNRYLQRTIFQTSVVIHSAPRILDAIMQFNRESRFAHRVLRALSFPATSSKAVPSPPLLLSPILPLFGHNLARTHVGLTLVSFGAHLLELGALNVVAFYTSNEHFETHKWALFLFITASLVGMSSMIAVQCVRLHYTNPELRGRTAYLPLLPPSPDSRGVPSDAGYSRAQRAVQRAYRLEAFSFALKLVCAPTVVVSLSIGGYLYWRHNQYCEPYLYSFFALCEYIAIGANIVFRWASGLDLSPLRFHLACPPALLGSAFLYTFSDARGTLLRCTRRVSPLIMCCQQGRRDLEAKEALPQGPPENRGK